MQGSKSTLVLGQCAKKEFVVQDSSGKEIEYKQMSNSGEFVGEMSDEEKEAEFNRMHEQYVKMKVNRKKQLIRIKREEFGTSSSDQQNCSSEEEIEEHKPTKKSQVKRSKGKQEKKSSFKTEPDIYSVLLQLKKLCTQTELVFMEKDFQINKRILPFVRITRLSISVSEAGSKTGRKLRVGIGSDEDIVISGGEELKGRDKLMEIFMRLLRIRLDLKSVKLTEESRCRLQEFGELGEGALIYDRIFKKSQIIGTWQQRYIVIRKEGILSYRTLKSKPTMVIGSKEIKEVQCHFEYYKEQLVVKLVYGNTKTDFGVPLDSKMRWVQQFAQLVGREG